MPKQPSRTKTARELALLVLQARKPNILSTVEIKPSKHSLLKACIYLRDVGAGDMAIELYGWMMAEYPIIRGRRPAANGEQRVYAVQRTREGIPFARVPLHTLGVDFGERVVCEFVEGKVIVMPENEASMDNVVFCPTSVQKKPEDEKPPKEKKTHPDSVFVRYADE